MRLHAGAHHHQLEVIFRPTANRPVCLGIEYPHRTNAQSSFTVGYLWIPSCGAHSLTRVGTITRLHGVTSKVHGPCCEQATSNGMPDVSTRMPLQFLREAEEAEMAPVARLLLRSRGGGQDVTTVTTRVTLPQSRNMAELESHL
jgi:hypothetical protein